VVRNDSSRVPDGLLRLRDVTEVKPSLIIVRNLHHLNCSFRKFEVYICVCPELNSINVPVVALRNFLDSSNLAGMDHFNDVIVDEFRCVHDPASLNAWMLRVSRTDTTPARTMFHWRWTIGFNRGAGANLIHSRTIRFEPYAHRETLNHPPHGFRSPRNAVLKVPLPAIDSCELAGQRQRPQGRLQRLRMLYYDRHPSKQCLLTSRRFDERSITGLRKE
jgi:hypothetical protein